MHGGAVKELFNVLTTRDAFAKLEAYLHGPVAVERVRTEDALGRVLAESLDAPGRLPTFRRSTMDGFAVRAEDTFGASEGLPAYLTIVDEVLMGRPARRSPELGETVRIATGGMLPDGADAVVMMEHTQDVDATTIEVLRPVAPGEHVIQIGEDVETGVRLLDAGHALRPQDVGGLLALGITEVGVSKRLRVGIISGGDEIVSPDRQPGPGQIRDINTYTIATLVERAGHTPVKFGVVPDVYEALETAAREALPQVDVLILSAGSSVSTRDMTAQVIASLGTPGVLVHGVSLKPGKPTILAMIGDKPVFGLPGNPVSCMVTFDLFVGPTLHRLAGRTDPEFRQTVSARLTRNVASAPGREDYFQVRLDHRPDGIWAEPVFGKSNLIYTLVKSDGMVRIDLDTSGLTEGQWVQVILF
ncbi:MAG: molybdopterin molybdotransferase MoeA [Chloroflexi bacterium]|nr:molybdopterin molybdotransferase MoeA [Chloroflexota bacterium]